MTEKKDDHPFLRRPLYVYDLPSELLRDLSVGSEPGSQSLQAEETNLDANDTNENVTGNSLSSSTSCALCQVSFGTVQDQRHHVRSDFHRYNLKTNLRGIPSVDETTFNRMIGDLDESISGSESSESEDEDDKSTDSSAQLLTALLKKQAKMTEVETENLASSSSVSKPGKTPVIWLSSTIVPSHIRLGIYRAILSKEEQDELPNSLPKLLQTKQLLPLQAKSSGNAQVHNGIGTDFGSPDPHWFLCMLGGGHFAAMIVSLRPEIRKGPGGLQERHTVVKAHKTFHRYTTRRKQGGSQSANDNAKGNAHSAGSSIRRYNEAALEADIREVLVQWQPMIDTADLLFIRAPGTSNRRVLFGPYTGQVLHSNDGRIRGFPFNTRRATQSELLRSFQELTRMKVASFVEVKPEISTAHQTVPKPAKVEKVTAPKLSKEDEASILHTSQIQALIRRSKAPALLQYLSKNALSADFRFFPETEHTHAPTPLHFSASNNSPASVIALITKAKANPTTQSVYGKVAYDIASDNKTKDAFRIARHELGEDSFEWSTSHIPSALSQEEANINYNNERAESEAAETRRRQADLEKLRTDEEQRNVGRIERKAGLGKTVTAQEKTGSDKREEELRGLTPEMRVKLERERRARAVEDRMRKMQTPR